MNQKDLIRYAVLGLGAVAAGVVASKFGGALLSNKVMAFGFAGITLGAVVVAGVGVLAADQLIK